MNHLARDRRGMILIVALPMTALIVGALCYLLCVGDGIVFRERLQDTADATAFESAVRHARGMNAVVCLNLLLAVLSSIGSGFQLIHALAPPSLGAVGDPALALSPRLAAVSAIVSETQAAVITAAPQLAIAEASENNSRFYRALGAADGGLAFSHAALPRAEQAELRVDPQRNWLFALRATPGNSPSTAPGRLPFQSGNPSAGPAPLELDPDVENGNVLLQSWSLARSTKAARRGVNEHGLRLASLLPLTVAPIPTAVAQAEFYFDCAGTWAQCAADAVWRPRWTARLRRFRSPAPANSALARTSRHAFEREASLLPSRELAPLAREVSALFANEASLLH